MNELLEIFRKVSGLNTHHVAVSYHPELAVEFDGHDNSGNNFHIGSGVTDSLVRSACTLALLQKHKILERLEHEISGNWRLSPMAKMSEAAQRITALKHSIDRQVDELTVKADAVAQMAPEAFARAHDVLDQTKKDIQDMAAEIGQVTNA